MFLPGQPRGQNSLADYSPWGRTESDPTEATKQQQQHKNREGIDSRQRLRGRGIGNVDQRLQTFTYKINKIINAVLHN